MNPSLWTLRIIQIGQCVKHFPGSEQTTWCTDLLGDMCECNWIISSNCMPCCPRSTLVRVKGKNWALGQPERWKVWSVLDDSRMEKDVSSEYETHQKYCLASNHSFDFLNVASVSDLGLDFNYPNSQTLDFINQEILASEKMLTKDRRTNMLKVGNIFRNASYNFETKNSICEQSIVMKLWLISACFISLQMNRVFIFFL